MTVLRHVCPLIVTRTGARTRPKTAGTSTGTTTNVPDPSVPGPPRSARPTCREPYKPDRRRPPARYCPSGMQTASALDILVVDDDEPLRDMLTRSFEREGHRVTAVPDGHAALARASEQDFDVVLLDVALGSGPAGHDVARALRARRAVVPIIMLTALDSEADVVQGLEAGADDYVTKPFGLAELRSRIRAVLRRAQGRVVEGVVAVGPITIDQRARQVTVNGAP